MKKSTWILLIVILLCLGGFVYSKFSSTKYALSNLGVASVNCNNLTGYAGLTSTIDVNIDNKGEAKTFTVEISCFDKNGELIKEKSKDVSVGAYSTETKTLSVPGRTRECRCSILN